MASIANKINNDQEKRTPNSSNNNNNNNNNRRNSNNTTAKQFNFENTPEAVLKKQHTPTIIRFKWKKSSSPPIGQGRYGTVHKIFKEIDPNDAKRQQNNDSMINNVLAAKICSVEEVRTPSPSANRTNSVNNKIVKPLRKEVEILSGLNHPNIIKCIGYERTFSHFTIFFELMEGGSLRQYINKVGGLNEMISKKYMRQIVIAVSYLHDDCDIVHRDIKAANIFLDKRFEQIKLCDFGGAKRLRHDLSARSDRSITGSPLWMAPEVIKQEINADEERQDVEENVESWKRADIWSVGCTMVEICTGKAPWGNMTSLPAAMIHIASTTKPPPLNANASMLAKEFVQSCCHLDSSERLNAKE